MSILGTVVRMRREDSAAVAARLAGWPGTDVALDPGDGRLVVLIEDAEVDGTAVTAAATMATIAQWPEVLNLSLVYEYSGQESPAPAGSDGIDYQTWRTSLAEMSAR
ncbi:periplasmic nitrate reductase chaperone NapD [Sphaerotilus hippei]|uniref:Periplasmic nitrate reductase chaperone NapD n=1 Tax=Sphaerotilus hippei TaxID=744406 RepID=A0A318GVA8_9BURK|nr:chaperone NapD [Sphaerotilus hippei]PXW93389.1 periplasmic nitrate reductase chaperone NapD [Sphaerotilus hippei]